MKIHFFWTWGGINLSSDNTYFLIEEWKNNLQVDCSWWLWLSRKVMYWSVIFDNLFITHKHPDHILWFFHLFRTFKPWLLENLNVFCSDNVKQTIFDVSTSLWSRNKKILDWNSLSFESIDWLDKKEVGEFILTPINLNSSKIEQFWFLLECKEKRILFFWDEAFWVLERQDLDKYIWVDYLIIEALSPEYIAKRSWWTMDTERMCHITSKDAGIIASKLWVKNLILIHTLDICDTNRQSILKKDARSEYSWNIVVPNDWDILEV